MRGSFPNFKSVFLPLGMAYVYSSAMLSCMHINGCGSAWENEAGIALLGKQKCS